MANTPAAIVSLTSLAAFDQLATLVAVLTSQGQCLHVNAALEDAVGWSRRALVRASLVEWLVQPEVMLAQVQRVASNEVATCRFDTSIRRRAAGATGPAGELPVLAILSQFERRERAREGSHELAVLVELIETEQQQRQDREERAQSFGQANKELLRNLAHEIKNPLGGIRGAAQLLEMELASRGNTTAAAPAQGSPPGRFDSREYTQVIIHEADRLQALVDRLLAPHRHARHVSDVNIHEVLERVRSLVLAEYPRGLAIVRDYDTSIPEFRGDREQLIQAVLNIAQNAAQALAAQIGEAAARMVLRTRVVRQATIGGQRYKLALELQVQDNGPGVPEALRERIFQPLVSGRDGGSGLGLTLAETFVQQHMGSIECESQPGRTAFILQIPLP